MTTTEDLSMSQGQLYLLTAAVGELTGAVKALTGRLETHEEDARIIREMVAAIAKQAERDRLQSAHDRIQAQRDRAQAEQDRANSSQYHKIYAMLVNRAKGIGMGVAIVIILSVAGLLGIFRQIKEWAT